MGNLTNDMTRLRENVEALRSSRRQLRLSMEGDARLLTESVASMLKDMRLARADMAGKNGAERLAFVTGLTDMVTGLRSDWKRAHTKICKKAQTERKAYLTGIRQTVAGLRNDNRSDLDGAGRAWFGPTPKELKAAQEKENKRRQMEEEARIRQEEEARARLEEAEKKIIEDPPNAQVAPQNNNTEDSPAFVQLRKEKINPEETQHMFSSKSKSKMKMKKTKSGMK